MAVERLLHTRQCPGDERQQGSPQWKPRLQAITGGEGEGSEDDENAEVAQDAQTLTAARRQLGGIDDESAGDLAGDEGHCEHGHADPRNGRGLCDDDETAAQTPEQHPPGQRTVPQQGDETSAGRTGSGRDGQGDTDAEEPDEERDERGEDGVSEHLTEQTVRSSLQRHRSPSSDRDETGCENRNEGRRSHTIRWS